MQAVDDTPCNTQHMSPRRTFGSCSFCQIRLDNVLVALSIHFHASFAIIRHYCCHAVLHSDFTGRVPASFGGLTGLSQLDLEFNFLSGKLSSQQLCPAGNRINALMLRANNFTGDINLRNCRNLTVVDLQVGGRPLDWWLLV